MGTMYIKVVCGNCGAEGEANIDEESMKFGGLYAALEAMRQFEDTWTIGELSGGRQPGPLCEDCS